jgi:hypothetical protein
MDGLCLLTNEEPQLLLKPSSLLYQTVLLDVVGPNSLYDHLTITVELASRSFDFNSSLFEICLHDFGERSWLSWLIWDYVSNDRLFAQWCDSSAEQSHRITVRWNFWGFFGGVFLLSDFLHGAVRKKGVFWHLARISSLLATV